MLREHDVLVDRLAATAKRRHRGPAPSAVLSPLVGKSPAAKLGAVGSTGLTAWIDEPIIVGVRHVIAVVVLIALVALVIRQVLQASTLGGYEQGTIIVAVVVAVAGALSLFTRRAYRRG